MRIRNQTQGRGKRQVYIIRHGDTACRQKSDGLGVHTPGPRLRVRKPASLAVQIHRARDLEKRYNVQDKQYKVKGKR